MIDIHLNRALAIKMMVVSATMVSTAGLIFRSLDSIDAFEVIFFRGLALTLSMIVIISVFYRNKAVKATKGIGFSGLSGAAFLHLRKLFMCLLFQTPQ